MLGYGDSAKVVDFVDGRGLRIRHVAHFCDVMGVDSAHFVGNSMGAINLLTDLTSDAPVLPVRSLALICGGGAIQRNEHADALYDYDASVEGMRRIVTALFFDPAYPADDDYVLRRHASSTAPGRVGGDRGGAIPSTGSDAARDTVHRTCVRTDHGADPGDRGWGRQTAACRAGPPTSPVGSPTPARRSSTPQATARNSNEPDVVNDLLLDFLEGTSTS